MHEIKSASDSKRWEKRIAGVRSQKGSSVHKKLEGGCTTISYTEAEEDEFIPQFPLSCKGLEKIISLATFFIPNVSLHHIIRTRNLI